MKPSIKLASVSFALATLIIFSVWIQLEKLSELNDFLKIAIGTITSLGLYRLIAQGIIELMKKSRFIKRFFLGTHYLEGTWVGFYIGSSGKERFLIERFEQNIDGLIIRGKSFDENFKFHASWTSQSVNIDADAGKITYMYECFPIKDQSNHNGVAIFNFERANQNKKANGLYGFSADLHIGQRCRALEEKIGDKCSIDESEALKKAKELFNRKKDTF